MEEAFCRGSRWNGQYRAVPKGHIRASRPLRPLWVAQPQPHIELEIRPKRRGDDVQLFVLNTETEYGDVWDLEDEDAAKAKALAVTALPSIQWRRPR